MVVRKMPREVELIQGQILERPLPHSADAERAILGAVILDNSLIYQAQFYGLEEHHFYVRAHQFVYRAMLEIADKGGEINPILLGEKLRALGLIEQTGGVAFISELTYGLPHFTNVATYAKVVMDKSNLRDLIKVCNMLTWKALEEEDDPDELIKAAESTVLALSSVALRGNRRAREVGFVKVVKDKADFRKHLEALHRGQSASLSTGIAAIDDKLEGGGLNPQGQYLVAANPKAGKTSLVLNICDRIARQFAQEGSQRSVGVVSMEMRRLALHMRRFSAHTQIPFSEMSRKHFRGPAYEIAMRELDAFFDIPLYISDSIFSLDDAWRHCEKLVYGEAQAGLLVFDYLQLMSRKRRQALSVEHRTAEVTVISRELKHMAQEFNVPLIAISSLSRAGELRESGAIDYDLEALIMLENADLPDDLKPEARKALVKALNSQEVWNINAHLKYQRNGPTGDIMLKFVRPYMQFLTLEEYAALYERPRTQLGPASADDEDIWNSTK
jgi:replicative DNA helicase